MVRVILDNDRNISYGCGSPDISDKHHEEINQPEKVFDVSRGGTGKETGSKVHNQVSQISTWHKTKSPEWSVSTHLTTTILVPIWTPAADND